MSRPQSFREVSSAVTAGTKSFGFAIDEFLDTFYLDHPDKLRQQRRIDDPPAIIGDPFVDSWIGAVGEHLFTFVEPLQRARFPREVKRIELPV
jgi:hypothetical protein